MSIITNKSINNIESSSLNYYNGEYNLFNEEENFNFTPTYIDPTEYDVWEPPAYWPVLPEVDPSEQRVVGTWIIFPGFENKVVVGIANELQCIINWGDGTTNVYGNIHPEYIFYQQKTHTYNYDTVDSPILFDDMPEGSLGEGGYKIVTIDITFGPGHPKHPTNFFTTFDMSGIKVNRWLDLIISGPELTTLSVNYSPQKGATYLRRISVLSNNLQSTTNLFKNCFNLKSVPVLNLPETVSAEGLFENCFQLEHIGDLTFKYCNNFKKMFYTCLSLRRIKWFDMWCIPKRPKTWPPTTQYGPPTNATEMFSRCILLETIPILNTSQVFRFGGMFSGCLSFIYLPPINTSNGRTFSRFFDTGAALYTTSRTLPCHSLKHISPIDTSNAKNITYMLWGATHLITMPPFNFSSVNNLNTFSLYDGNNNYNPWWEEYVNIEEPAATSDHSEYWLPDSRVLQNIDAWGFTYNFSFRGGTTNRSIAIHSVEDISYEDLLEFYNRLPVKSPDDPEELRQIHVHDGYSMGVRLGRSYNNLILWKPLLAAKGYKIITGIPGIDNS